MFFTYQCSHVNRRIWGVPSLPLFSLCHKPLQKLTVYAPLNKDPGGAETDLTLPKRKKQTRKTTILVNITLYYWWVLGDTSQNVTGVPASSGVQTTFTNTEKWDFSQIKKKSKRQNNNIRIVQSLTQVNLIFHWLHAFFSNIFHRKHDFQFWMVSVFTSW